MTRKFDDRPATREKTPVLVGIVGPSGTGKTYSALRLAAGFQRVTGGETFLIDTEARRSLHYAEKFQFRHVSFGAPFSPLDYLDAINYCLGKGATTIVIDSMSHEHEGPGGVLEMHEEEKARLAKAWNTSEEATQMPAWSKPKSQRRRLINSILQMSCNFIFCFRAKQKLKILGGKKKPESRGWQPIAGEEFMYEMTLKLLLLPGANGIPTLASEIEDERAMIKTPEQFRGLFNARPQLSEEIGQAMATWGAGSAITAPPSTDELAKRFEACSDAATLRTLEDARRAVWDALGAGDKKRLKAAADAAAKRLATADRLTDAPAAEEKPAPAEEEPSASQTDDSDDESDPDADLDVDATTTAA